MSAAASRQAAISSSSTPSARASSGVARGDLGRHRAGSARPSGSCRRCRRRSPSTRPGPVTPSMWNAPAWSWWPSERHSRAVCDEQLEARRRPRTSSSPVALQVADDGVGDVGVDVERRRAGRPVRRALLPADRAPRERRALQAQLARALHARGRASRGASAARRAPPPGACRSAAAARTSPCPRTRGRRSPGRSGPWPGSRAARPARRPAACGRARSGRPAGARRRPRSRRRRGPRTLSRYSRWAAHELVPARAPGARPPRRRPGRAPTAASAGSTSRRRGTW